jgi:Cu/Ag efflux protein CusF
MRALHFAATIGLAGLVSISSDFISRAGTLQQTPDPGIQAKGAIGEVKSIDAASKLVTIKTDAGSAVMVLYTDKTTYKKLAPGEQSLTSATDITFKDVAEGDRIWARGTVAEDRKSVSALQIVVMSKGDIAKKQEAERLEWRRRGILGVIATLKPDTKEITISSRTMAGMQSVIIPVSDKTEMRRYAPDSIKFSEAKASSFGELKVGDQLRALGERASDGTHFTPQKVVTGSFRTVAGTVTTVDPATGEIKIKDLEKKQALTIVIKQDAVLRKFPPASEMGGMMGGNRPGGGPGGPAPQSERPQGNPQGQGGPGGPRGGGGGFNINDMLERLPIISIADVKVGDTIIVSSTQGVDPTRLTAIALVSGADTLLTMLAPRQQPGQAAPNPAAGLGSGISFGIGLP